MGYPREYFRPNRGRRRRSSFSAMNFNNFRGYNNNRSQDNYNNGFMDYNRPRNYNNQSRYRNQGYQNRRPGNQSNNFQSNNFPSNNYQSNNRFNMEYDNVPRKRFSNKPSNQRMKRARSVDDLRMQRAQSVDDFRMNSNRDHNRGINNDWNDTPNKIRPLIQPRIQPRIQPLIQPLIQPIKTQKKRPRTETSWTPFEEMGNTSDSNEETESSRVIDLFKCKRHNSENIIQGHNSESIIQEHISEIDPSINEMRMLRCFACQCFIVEFEDLKTHINSNVHKQTLDRLLSNLSGIVIKNDKDRAEACKKSQFRKHVSMEFMTRKSIPKKDSSVKPRQGENNLEKDDLDF